MAKILAGLKPETVKRFKETMMYLRLTPQMRRKVMQKVLWRMKDNAKKSVSAQKTPEGKSWVPRKRQEKSVRKNRMLKMRAKYLNSKLEQQGNVGILHYTDAKGGEIGAIHQYGLTVNVEQTAKEKKALEKLLAQNKEPATPQQAKRLKELGYSVSKGGRGRDGKKKKKKATGRDIRSSLSKGQAGLIIRMMEKKQGINIRRGLKSYKMAARPFLDEDETRNADIITEELLKAFAESGYHLQP